MSEYDFSTLSPHDFELLSRDLLQEHLELNLESFSNGRDMGIDLRYSKPANGTNLIVQCKHYYRSGFTKLLSTLKSLERQKVDGLRPSRYLLITSVSLSPANKKEILDVLTPYCQGPADVFGKEDVNNLLGIYPQIEKKHFKLWLPSTEVLQRLLNNGLFTQTALEIDEIKRHLSLFVATPAVERGMEMLKTRVSAC
jgi:hypothetical protein